MSKDQSPGAVTMSPVCDAPHLVYSEASVAVAPSECDAAVVLSDPLLKPEKVPVPVVFDV